MIPISVSDILKILDQVPVWKKLASLPRRIEALEARVAELESVKSSLQLSPRPEIDPAKACPKCGSEMKVVAEKVHPIFGVVGGLKIHQMACPDCSHTTERDFSPSKGYQ